jgi:hypothetical protein
MRPNGTFRTADASRIFKAAKEAGLRIELELEKKATSRHPRPMTWCCKH